MSHSCRNIIYAEENFRKKLISRQSKVNVQAGTTAGLKNEIRNDIRQSDSTTCKNSLKISCILFNRLI